MINDMLETEIEQLWLQREKASWRRHDPKYAWQIPFWVMTAIVLGIFGWQVVLTFIQFGIGYGLASCLLTVFIWAGPAMIIAKRANGRDEYRMLRGNTPRSAEDIAALRGLQQVNRIEAPSYKTFQEWLKPHMQTTSDKATLGEYARETGRYRQELLRDIGQQEHDRQERIRILLSPYNGNGASSGATHHVADGNGKTPGRFGGPGSDS